MVNFARTESLKADEGYAGFEQANQPTITDADRRKLLNFCIVGGGPTGVEFAAELHDFLHTDIARHYPALARMAKINLYDVAPSILGGFDTGLQEYVLIRRMRLSALEANVLCRRYATSKFKREGIRLLTQHHVQRVEQVSCSYTLALGPPRVRMAAFRQSARAS